MCSGSFWRHSDPLKNKASPNSPLLHPQWGQNQTAADGLGPVDYLVVIDGTSQMAAFDAWLGAVEAGAAPPRRLWNQEASYPCDACCSGGQ